MKLIFYLLLSFLPALASTQASTTPPTISIFDYDIAMDSNAHPTLNGSIISIGPTATTYAVICPTPVPTNNITWISCFMNSSRTIIQGPSTFAYTLSFPGFTLAVGCSLQSTTAASCTTSQSASDWQSAEWTGPIQTGTQLACGAPIVTYLPVRITGGIPTGSSLTVVPVATLPATTTTSLVVSTSKAAAREMMGRNGGGLWEMIAGGILGVVVLL